MTAAERQGGRSGLLAGWLRRPGREIGRLAAVVALLVLAALGASARGATRLSPAGLLGPAAGPVTEDFGIAVIAVACLALAGLVAVLAWRIRRRRDDGEPDRVPEPAGTRWQRVIALAAFLALLALPVIALVIMPRGWPAGMRTGSPVPVIPVVPRLPGPAPAHAHGEVAASAILLGAVAVALLITLAAVAAWRPRRRVVPAAGERPPAVAAALAAAVLASRRALGTADDAREAIIACYAAMEDALAVAGYPRRAAGIPGERRTGRPAGRRSAGFRTSR